MIYECEQCGTALPPAAVACPKCGEAFEEPVPQDAVVRKSGWKPKKEDDISIASQPVATLRIEPYPSRILPEEKTQTIFTQSISANQHSSYWTFTALGLLLWPVGIIVGTVLLTKSALLERKLGEHTVVMSVIGFVLGVILSALMFGGHPFLFGDSLHPSVTMSANNANTANSLRNSSVVKTLVSSLHIGPDPNNAVANDRLKQIGLAMTSYSQDHNENYPTMDTSSHVQSEISQYGLRDDATRTVVGPEVFIDPSSNLPWEFNAKFSGLNSLQKIEVSSCEIIAYSPQPTPDGGRYCLFADGHCNKLDKSKWNVAETTKIVKIDPNLGFSTDYTLLPQ